MNTREYYCDGNDGSKIPIEEAMVAKLLDDDVLFCNSRKYVDFHTNEIRPETLVLFVLCNDVFAWGCADAEEITLDEVPNLFELHEKNPKFGSVQWVCVKRNEKPQNPVVKWMKDHDGWNEVMESLPENQYDKLLSEK